MCCWKGFIEVESYHILRFIYIFRKPLLVCQGYLGHKQLSEDHLPVAFIFISSFTFLSLVHSFSSSFIHSFIPWLIHYLITRFTFFLFFFSSLTRSTWWTRRKDGARYIWPAAKEMWAWLKYWWNARGTFRGGGVATALSLLCLGVSIYYTCTVTI